MTFDELNKMYGVRVLKDKLDSQGRMSVGPFGSYDEAEEYLDDLRQVDGYHLPIDPRTQKEQRLVWPEQYRGPNAARLKQLTERNKEVHVHVCRAAVIVAGTINSF